MKKITIFLIVLLCSITSSWAFTREELFGGRYYRDYSEYRNYYSVRDNNVYDKDMESIFLWVNVVGSYTLNKDGSGYWSVSGSAETLSYDGVRAHATTSGEWRIPLKWTIVGDNIHVKLATNFSQKPTNPRIDDWYDHYVESQYQGMKRELNKWYQKELKEGEAYCKAMFGKTYIFEVHEENVTVGYYPNNDLSARAIKTRGYMITIEHEGKYVHTLGLRTSPLLDSSSTQSQPSSQTTTASYPYGDDGINKYVKQYIKYPTSVQQNGINASTYFTLDIGANGKVTSVTSSNYSGVDAQLIEQTKKLLKNLPNLFTPATKDGQNMASTYEVRIDYELEPALKLDKQSITFPYSSKEEKIKITARKDWTFTQPTNSSLSVRRDGNYLVVACQKRNEHDYDAITDKIVVYTTDNSASYTINISQAGAPRPFIKLEKAKVTIPRDGTAQAIKVGSNCEWRITNPAAEPKFKIYTTPTSITLEATKNRSKKGRSVVYGLKTLDGEYSTSLEVYQNGRSDEAYGTATSGYGRIYENYYERNGKYGITWANLKLGVGAVVPTFDEVYIPVNIEALALRIYMVELSLVSFRADFSLDGFDGLAWEPQVKFLLPINEKLAILPYVGPTCQMDIYDIHNSTWNFSAGAAVRLSWGKIAFSDFSIDYHGGPFGGLSMGVSIGFASGYRN